ncbi:hypothetical protein LSAT2_032576 [Lamellibrachia satsuma]|nr:hypothetical protein LSAT2_032576 [Lamellibrachia satsuma]
MELAYTLSTSVWEKADPDRVKGLSTFTVIRQERLSEGRFRYAVKEMKEREEDIRLTVVYVEDAVGNQGPLAHVKNCELVLDGDKVTAINLDGDCLVRKPQ